ncbi:beta-glucosidase [Subtercola boreus]|uniref:Beta-glucosidase n=1 Tax=Subtercola boreus TaxID=120213 RepID=A0A3E0VE66_9MICO|nr:family 1 glycosylhydrolase [Subtercola boreus]RFA08214.1 beta-glucosidase [Subtercola boreus]TQL54892.1 aryl-beta-glucosidase [Subtercola boreus]
MSETFAPDFLWGVATAGHQVEGDNNTSDTWFLEHVTPTIFRDPSGRACNSWELWQTDLDLAAGMGLNAFRFSVEWARIEPSPGEFSEEALAHYEALIDGCLARGLAPVVTFSHFTSPHWFAARGGFLDPESADLFARYCGIVMDRFGDRIALAVTFNEPNLCQMLSWANLPPFIADLERATLEAAARAAGVSCYRVGNVMLPEDFAAMTEGMTRAHLAAKAAIKARRPSLPVGLSIAIVDDVALPGGEELRDRKRAEVYDHWLDLARADDFIGVQNYERLTYDASGEVSLPTGTPVNEQGTAVEPDSLRGAVAYAFARSGVPVFVTEHGISAADDTLRAGFIEPSLAGLGQAMAAGIPVLGYCHWSLMDNFEWIFGYSRHLGLHSVDFTTFERTPKPSAAAYAAAVAARRTPTAKFREGLIASS